MAFNNISSAQDEITLMKFETMSMPKDDDSPQQQINEQSLAQDLEKNRESLKRKLQTRRSLKQLVDVGIMPPPKAPLPFYEQRKQLQMRKTQDILKNKIISRPDRQLLIEHNILSDTTAAPAIQKTQRQLKRARLADNLNDKLAARPGVLELVANNILEIDPNLKEAIQGGRIKFPSTKSSPSPILTAPVYCPTDEQPIPSAYPQQPQQQQQPQRPLRPKTSSFSNSSSGQSNAAAKRSLNSSLKAKASLTFHEYKGPSQKVEVTKVPLQPTASLIVQPVQATLVPLVPLETHATFDDDHYRIQLQQQQLFLELLHDNVSAEPDDPNDLSNGTGDDNPIGNLLQQPIDASVNLLASIADELQSFERMKLVDLKNHCRKLNLSTTGTKMKLIEKLRNARAKMSDTTFLSSATMNVESSASDSMRTATPSSIRLLVSTSSLSDHELYQQQQQKILELETQLQQLKRFDSYSPQSSVVLPLLDSTTMIPPKCNPILSVQIQKRILMQQQEKLKQKIHGEQQQQQQCQPTQTMVPLTPESVARFLANQSQSQPVDPHPWPIHHSTSAPSFLPFTDDYFDICPSNHTEQKLVDDDTLLSLLDDFTDANSTLTFPSDHSLCNPALSIVSSSPSTHMDWLPVASPSMASDFYDDNNADFTQFLNQFGNDHHLLFEPTLSTCQQSNAHSFDLLSPSSPMI